MTEYVTYSGPYVAPVFAAGVINAAWTLAEGKDAAFQATLSDSLAVADPNAPPTMSASTATPATVSEPTVYIPTSVDTSAIMSEYSTKYLELVALLETKFTGFRSTYFPNEAGVYSAAETWLKGAIENPEVGLPPAIAAAIYGDDQARILADTSRATEEMLATFAAKRFPLPPGAAASATLQIQQNAQDELAKSSRTVAMKALEMMQFAVSNTLKLRKDALDSCIEYIKALASGPDLASRVIGVGYDAQSKLIAAVSSFYNARTEAAKLTYAGVQHNADLAQEASKMNLQAEEFTIEQRIKALLANAQLLAAEATALFNNVQAQARTDFSESGA